MFNKYTEHTDLVVIVAILIILKMQIGGIQNVQ